MLGLASALFYGGGIVALIGLLMVLVEAFKESVVWGLLCLFIPLVALVFVATHWRKTRRGFFLWLGGAVAIALARLMLTSSF